MQLADHQAAERVRAKMKSESTPPPNAPPRTFVKPMQAAAQIGHVSPSVGLSASPTPRSISTPVPTSVATSPVEAPSAIRAAPPKQTAPARLTQTPRPTVAMTPAATPFRREPPKISPKPTPSVSAIPPVTATPTAGEIATAPPRPTFTPRLITPARPSTGYSRYFKIDIGVSGVWPFHRNKRRTENSERIEKKTKSGGAEAGI